MNIVFFTHPKVFNSRSMDKFSQMLAEGMQKRGHNVEIWSPLPNFYSLSTNKLLQKWLGYIDQFIKFPNQVRNRLQNSSSEKLYVFTDNALGPWVPLVAHLPHVIHCHDFLAQHSAKGLIIENPVKWTGKVYQNYIHKGYSQGKNFISVSEKTRKDLHCLLSSPPTRSEVVYNGLNQTFYPSDPEMARKKLSSLLNINLTSGYLLHVGGNEWYKNRKGVLEIYETWRKAYCGQLPFLLIGNEPDEALRLLHTNSTFKRNIFFLTEIQDNTLKLAYSGASVFLFPSLAEGFGWPIAEAMASGCPVITTDIAPMTEVGGKAAYLIPKRPCNNLRAREWEKCCAEVVDRVVNLTKREREKVVNLGILNAHRFDSDIALDKIEEIYNNTFHTTNTKTHSTYGFAPEIY